MRVCVKVKKNTLLCVHVEHPDRLCQVLRVLVGNKIDRDDHEIPAEVGEEFANR